MRLAYKVAIITGSAGGMGKLAAEVFAREGASIVVTDIAAKEGEETARAIREAGGKALFVKSNVTNEDEVKHMVNAAPLLQIHYPTHGQARQRFYHQYRIFCRLHGLYRASGCLYCFKGRHAFPNQILCGTIWKEWHTL